jgi:cell division protein FtsW
MAQKQKTEKKVPDMVLASVVAAILAVSLPTMFTVGIIQGDPGYYLFRHALWMAVGIVVAIAIAYTDYRIWKRAALPLMILTLWLLVVVLLFGTSRLGATRTLFRGSVQPSEAAKFVVVIYAAVWMEAKGKLLRDTKEGLIPFSIIIGLVVGLVAIEPDISTALIIAVTAIGMFFIARATIAQIGALLAVGGGTFLLLVTKFPHAASRLQAFRQYFAHPITKSSYQVRENILAIIQPRLGIFDFDHIKVPPLGWSDGVFALLGQEFGIFGTLLVLILFVFLAYRGYKIALQSEDTFGSLAAAGITTWLTFQAALNIAMATAAIPVMGVPLPFLSLGGSALVTSLAGVGLLLSISRKTVIYDRKKKAIDPGGRRKRGARLSTVSSERRLPRNPVTRRKAAR